MGNNSSTSNSDEPTAGIRRFLATLAGFLLPVFCALAWANYRLGVLPNAYRQKRQLIAERGPGAQILVLGSSHAERGIDAQTLGWPTINLASASQSLEVDSAIVETFAPQFSKLRLILAAFSYFSLPGRLSDSDERWRNYFYFQFLGVRGEQSTFDLWNVRNLFPLLAYGQIGGRARLFPEMDRRLPSGGIVFAQENPGEDDGLRARLHERAMYEKNIPANCRAIARLIQIADRLGARVAFVTLPVRDGYAAAMDPKRWAHYQSTLIETLRPYGVRYYDFLVGSGVVRDDFANADHLNSRGARKFSQMLNERVVRRELGSLR